MRRIDEIYIHCSGSSPSEDIGQAEIEVIHLRKGIRSPGGYQAIIRRNGQVERVRSDEEQGAHVRGHNEHSIGICLIGGLKEDGLTIFQRIEKEKYGTPDSNYTRAQYDALDKLLDFYTREHPYAVVKGHRDAPGVKKACPCFDAGEYHGKAVIG
jgi:N-acetylmuramoyl-L-alanine amidase